MDGTANRLIDLAAKLLILSRKCADDGAEDKSLEYSNMYHGVLMAIETSTSLTEYRATCIINDMIKR